MNSVRLAAIVGVAFFAASTASLRTQQDDGIHVTVQVTDGAGAPIPNAALNFMSPEEGRLLRFRADGRGIADLHLVPGEYQYRISSAGFCSKNGTESIDTTGSQDIRVKLEAENCAGYCSPSYVAPTQVEPRENQVTIHVSDVTGTVVAGARVEIDPSVSESRVLTTDGGGSARVGLRAGTHSVQVSAPGFRSWKGFAEVEGTEEVIAAQLRLAGFGDLEISTGSPEMEIPLYKPITASIAPQLVGALPLLDVPIRKHRRRH